MRDGGGGRTVSSMVMGRLRSRPMSREWRPRPRCLPWARRRAGSERHLPTEARSRRSSLGRFAGRWPTCRVHACLGHPSLSPH